MGPHIFWAVIEVSGLEGLDQKNKRLYLENQFTVAISLFPASFGFRAPRICWDVIAVAGGMEGASGLGVRI